MRLSTADRVWQTNCMGGLTMQSTTVPPTGTRANRVLVALAAAWMILSLAIGGAVSAGNAPDEPTVTSISGPVQP